MKRIIKYPKQNYYNAQYVPTSLEFEVTVEFPWWKLWKYRRDKVLIEKCAFVVVVKMISRLDNSADMETEVRRSIIDMNTELLDWGVGGMPDTFFYTQIRVNVFKPAQQFIQADVPIRKG